MDYGEKMKKQYQDYIQGLEEERRKIQVFERELPLCLDLVNQAIANCKQQLNLSECEEQQQTSTESPVLEQFIPLKRSLSSEEEENESAKKKQSNEKKGEVVDWMRSVQLWNPTPDPCSKSDLTLPAKIENKKSGGAFHPFLKDKSKKTSTAVVASSSSMPVPMAAATSSTGDNSNKSREDREGQRKARRCWSPELHRRFLQALQQLGGSHAATPKQIRELMKVDGLTNDEVKSHLQKYRLHTRRPAGSIHSSGNTQPTQFVLVGGIWVQPPEYSVTPATNGEATTTGTAPNGIYVPVATAPPRLAMTTCSEQPQQQQLQQVSPPGSSRRNSHSVGDDHTHSDSREATSSSSDTTTASPAS